MNCPKCGWPGLIAGSLKQRLAQMEDGLGLIAKDNEHLRAELAAIRFLIEFGLKKSDAELRELLRLYLAHDHPRVAEAHHAKGSSL